MATKYDTFPKKVNSLNELLSIIKWLKTDLKSHRSGNKKTFTWNVGRHRFPYGIWFRGERETVPTKRLLPGVFQKTSTRHDLDESFIFNHLQTRIPELASIANTFDKLCMAQHYNTPTRLLDWTESFLTAAYFAVTTGNRSRDDRRDGALYVLNTYSLNHASVKGLGRGRIHTPDDFGTLLRAEMAFCSNTKEWLLRVGNRCPTFDWDMMAKDAKIKGAFEDQMKLDLFRRPIAILPNRAFPRMVVQASTFTIHGGFNVKNPDECFTEIPEWVPDKSRRVWMKAIIPKEKKEKIEEELFALGIHESTLFPELETQRKYLVKVCRREKNEP